MGKEYKQKVLGYFRNMVVMQNDFNIETNGKDWISGVTKEGKIIDWRLCISQETSELIDSFPWKHWKSISQEPDLENAKMELIDVWHFIMSEMIKNMKTFTDKSVDHLINVFFESMIMSYSDFKSSDFNEIKPYIISMQNAATDKDMESVIFTKRVLYNFFSIANFLEIDIADIYELYLVKNVLNKFRQANGYKEGKYLKVIDDREDNEIIVEMAVELNDADNLSYNSLYMAYDFFYNKSKKDIEE